MIAIILALALTASDTPAQDPGREAAEASIQMLEQSLAQSRVVEPLTRRLLETARKAFAEGRYEDAALFAQRATDNLARVPAAERTQTAAAGPIIDVLLEAITRLRSVENRKVDDPRLAAARVIVETAEAALYAGRISQAEELARKAMQLLAAIPVSPGRGGDTFVVNVNTASAQELASLPGITAMMINNLIWFRTRIGPLLSVDEMRYIPEFSREYVELVRRNVRVR